MCANQEVYAAIGGATSSEKVIRGKQGTYSDKACEASTEALSSTPARASSVKSPFANVRNP